MKRTSIVVPKTGPYQTAPEVQVSTTIPTPNEQQVAIKVLSCGLAFPDILQVEDKHIEKRKAPFIVGREVSGVVTAIGKGVTSVSIGDHVFGASLLGGLTTHAVLDMSNVYKYSPRIDPHVAAGFELNYGTSFHALVDIGKIAPGETLLVLGASGGVGLAAVDIGKALGATVIACASSSAKLEVCRLAGADHLIDYSSPADMKKQIEQVTGGKPQGPGARGGVDLVFDAVGGEWSEAALRCLRWRGRHLVIGFASGGAHPKAGIPSLPLNLALLNERQILGVLWGLWRTVDKNATNRKNVEQMLEMVEAGKLKPVVSKVYDMQTEYKLAMEDMMNRRVVGKICLDPTGSKLSKL